MANSVSNGSASSICSKAEAESPIAADFSSDDEDADTQSLTPSITNYPVQWGRTYHSYKEDSYLFPNDDLECARLNLEHDCLKRLHGGRLFHSPISNPDKLLDLGTGTGVWPIQMAEIFPNARITGTDLSPIQPNEVPNNVHFEIDDCSADDWNRTPNSYDLIHTALMMGTTLTFYELIKTAKRYLKRGTGWLECLELDLGPFCDDGTMPKDWAVTRMIQTSEEASAMGSKPLQIATKLAPWMHQAGYVDIRVQIKQMPLNPWPRDPFLKQLGRDWEMQCLAGLSGWTYKLYGGALGWTREQIEVFLVDVRKAYRDRHVHAYHRVYVVCGRRPSEDEERRMGMPAPSADYATKPAQ